MYVLSPQKSKNTTLVIFCVYSYQESHFYTTTRSTFPLTTRPPLSTNRPMRKTTSSSDYYTSTREASREIYVTTDGIPRVPTADGQEEVNASENNTFTGTVGMQYTL